MSHDREKVKADLTAVILAYLKSKNIEPTDSTRVMMAGPGIWRALINSGKMPRNLTYDMMMSGITSAMLSQQFNNIFRG